MFESTGVRELFPTQVWVHQLPQSTFDPLNRGLLDRLDTLTSDLPRTEGRTLQTAATFHEQPEAAELVSHIRAAVSSVLGFLAVSRLGFVITGCWANINAPGAVHPRHCHPNNFLSGTYYVQTEEGSNSILFDDPRPHWTMINPARDEQRPEISSTVELTVRPGMLIVFPSWLMHYVGVNRSASPRVSVSFNIMFEDFAGTVSPTQWDPNVPLP